MRYLRKNLHFSQNDNFKNVQLGTTKRRQPPKKRAPPKKRKKPDPDSDLEDFIAPDDQSSEEILSDPEGDEEIAKGWFLVLLELIIVRLIFEWIIRAYF